MSGKSSNPESSKKNKKKANTDNNEQQQPQQTSDSDSLSAYTFSLPSSSTTTDPNAAVVHLLQQQLQQQREAHDALQRQLSSLLQQQSSVKTEQSTTSSATPPQLRIELFGVQQATSLGEAPRYSTSERFATWKQKIVAFVGAHGLDPLVLKPPADSWNDALTTNPPNVPVPMLQRWYVQAGKRIVHAISLAVLNAGLDADQLCADARSGKPNNGTVTIGSMCVDVDANPYLIMQTLCDKYDTKTPYAALSIFKKLLEMRWDRSKVKGSTHLQAVRDLLTQLNRLVADDRPKAGECFGETMQAIIYLNTLPTSLATDVKILTTQDKITVAQVESVVRKYDDIQPTTAKSDKPSDKANAFVQDKRAGKDKSRKKQNKKEKHNKSPASYKMDKGNSSSINEGDVLNMLLFELPPEHANDSVTDDDDHGDTLDEHQALAAKFTTEQEARTIVLDSGATRHTWSQPADVVNVRKLDNPMRLLTVTGSAVHVNKTGSVQITPSIRINDVAVVPQSQVNLMSVSRVTRAGFRVVFDGHEAYIVSRTSNKVYLKFTQKDGLYVRELAPELHPNKPRPKFTDGFQVQPVNKPAVKPDSKQGSKTDKPTKANATTSSKPASAASKPQQVAPVQAKKPATAALLYETMYHLAEASEDATHADNDTSHTAPAAADQLVHERYGHQSYYSNADCETCLATRAKRVPITRKPHVSATHPLGTIVADLIGPMSAMIDGQRQSLPSLGGNSYILVVVDEFTRHSWVRLLQRKSDTAAQVCNLLVLLKRQYNQYPIRRFHTDGGLEFVNRTIDNYCASEGINHTTTTRDKPAHNGKAERFNQTLIAMIRSMLHGCSAHPSLWGDAALQACYVYNRTPLRVINGSTPYELLNGQQPDLSKIKVFGSNVFYSINENERSKIQATSHKGVWIGWDERKNAHRVLINTDGHVIASRDVKHVESKFSHLAELMGADPESAGSLGSSTAAIDQPSSATHSNAISLAEDSYDSDTVVAADTPISAKATTASSPPQSPQHSPPDDQPYTDDDGFDAGTEERYSTDADDYDTDPGDAEDNSTASYSTDSDDADSDEHTDTVGPLNDSNPPVHIPASTTTTTRSGRAITPVLRYGLVPIGDLDTDDQRSLLSGKTLALSETLPEPQSYSAALRHPDAAHYQLAASKEIASMAAQDVYELVPYHPSMNVIRSKWVFKVKRDQNNMPVKYKARLVAKGFQQKEGVDYFDTFAPVVKNKSMRMLFALAVHYRLVVKQIDFVTAFLNAELDEVIYMYQPEGFEVRDDTGRKLVWRLKKALYGLKQAPRQWNGSIDATLVKLGYEPTVCDPCIYVKRMDGYPPILLSLYVDDTCAAYHPELEQVWLADKASISQQYPITDIGDCSWVLNMEVTQASDRRTITLSQRAYIERVLQQYNMLDCKPAPTPLQQLDLTDPALKPGEPLSIEQHMLYRKIVGSTLYAANTTRIDIAHSVGMLARFVSAPTTTHLTAAKHLLRYLRGTMDYCLKFVNNGQSNLQLTVYADSNWSGDKTDRKSTTGYIVQLNSNTISWQSKKQPTVALSSTEAEYMGLSAAVCEARWASMLLQQMTQTVPTVELLCDNQSAIALVRSDNYSERTKHIDTRHHFIKQFVRDGSINLQWIPTEEQLADVLTKTLNRTTHTTMTNRLLAH